MNVVKMDLVPISFKTKLFAIGTWTILRLPESASAKLPSRGQVMTNAVINGFKIKTPLEPDGKWGHWLHIDEELSLAIKAAAGDVVKVELFLTKDWPEPDLPADIKKALAAAPKSKAVWDKATPMAHWEWLRWIRATNRQETREKRIEVGMSKLEKGERRPCCWNRNLCSEPSVSKNGILLDPAA